MDIDHASSDITPADMLAWLIEMGADEIVAESPVDRYAASAVVEKPKAAPALVAAAAVTLPDQSAADALAQATACGSIEALTQALNYFDANPLRKGATQLCFIEGNLSSSVVVLGDRPRTEEDKSGQVFAGKSRELLTRMLSAIELKIEDVVLMNFIPWRPPGNRAPLENEIAMCLPFAARALEILSPKMILSFGALGGQHLAGGDASIIRQRGKWLSVGNAAFISTLHPEELLKFPAQKKLAWRDLLAFKMKMEELK